jgi:hypothetical protein
MAEKTTHTSARDFFLWLAAVAALYVSIISMIALVFEYINRLVGEPFIYTDPFSTGIRIAMASLIIIFPLYVLFTRMLNKDIRRNPEKKELWVRRWLLVLTLFIAGATMVIDLIVLLNRFLGGEVITTAFLLKVLAVLIVAGGAFLYYLHDIKGTWEKKERQSVMIGWIVGSIVLVTIVSGFFIVGSPQTLRDLRYDQERVSALQNLQYQVLNHWQRTERLPESLASMEDPLSGFIVPVDPETGEPYEYSILNNAALTFELCAIFNRASGELEGADVQPKPVIRDPFGNAHWQHDAGRQCFERTIDPELYPVIDREVLR